MEKLVYALWREPSTTPADVAGALLNSVATQLLAADITALTVHVEAPEGRAMRMGRPADGFRFTALVSVWLDSYDRRAALETALATVAGTRHTGWLVTESEPLAYAARDWPDGTRSPGIGLVTLFDALPGVGDADFYARWHGSHTPLTFEIHPVTLYTRNAIARPVTPDAPSVRGIVVESVESLDVLLDLHAFYGSGGDEVTLAANMTRIGDDFGTFGDLSTLETCPMWEWILRS